MSQNAIAKELRTTSESRSLLSKLSFVNGPALKYLATIEELSSYLTCLLFWELHSAEGPLPAVYSVKKYGSLLCSLPGIVRSERRQSSRRSITRVSMP